MSTVDDLTDLAVEGYLPTGIDTAAGVVTLTRLAHRSFHEVWYDDTVATVSADKDTRTVPFAVFTERFADRLDSEHLRLIAHTSRCGSTLLANLLTLRPASMVLKEPDFVTIPARHVVLASDAAESGRYRSLLRALLNFGAHAAAVAGRALVVKLTSWTVPVVLACQDGDANTTWLLLWREPGKVVASNMATPPAWGRDTENGRAARRLMGVDNATARFYAKTWCQVADAFLSAEKDLRWRCLAYQDLAREKATSLVAAERWFDLSPDGGLPADFQAEAMRYAKGGRSEVFEPTKSHRRDPLQPHDASEVDAITRQASDLLREERDHRLF